MDFYSFPPIAVALDAIYAVLNGLTSVLDPALGSLAPVLAVVALTVLIRFVLLPVGMSTVKAEFARKRIAPLIAQVQKRYSKQPEKLQRELMELHRREKVSPFAGMLPLLAQAPVLTVVYALFTHTEIHGRANALLSHELFGVPLGLSFTHAIGGAVSLPSILLFGTVLGMIAVVAQLSRRFLAAPIAPDAPAAGVARALSFLPFLTVVFAAIVPLAAAFYLLTSTAWTVAERLVLRRVVRRRLLT